MRRKDRKAFDIVHRALDHFEAKTGEQLFVCGRYRDRITDEKYLVARGPRELAEEYLQHTDEAELRKIHDIHHDKEEYLYSLPDLRNKKWWTIAEMRHLIPPIVRVENDDMLPHWGDNKYRPIWWPCEVPFVNPKQGLKVRQMQHIMVAAFSYFNALPSLGDKGAQLVKEFHV